MKILKLMSLSSYGLGYKLKIAFYLMSVLPLLICFYLISSYLLPIVGIKLNIMVLIGVSIFIASSGFFVVRQIVSPIINISSRAKNVIDGNITYEIESERDDEIGDLENTLAKLTLRIKGNMQELKRYSEQTKEINLEINRQIVALSGLLQVSAFISEGEDINKVFDLIMEKMAQIGDSDSAFLLLQEEGDLRLKSAYGADVKGLLNKRFKITEDNLFAKIIRQAGFFSLDNNTLRSKAVAEFEQEFGVKNAFIAPVFVRNKIAALAGIANSRGFEYKNENLKLINIFLKQITIAIENDMLMRRLKNLEVKDALTGLYNESFIRTRLDEEIKRAILYQRPCAFILFSVNGYKEFCQNFTLPEAEAALKMIALALKESITDIDRAARFSDSEFAVVLPEKNKKQAQAIAEIIKQRMEFLFNEEPDRRRRLMFNVAVTENPIDGVKGFDLIYKATQELENYK